MSQVVPASRTVCLVLTLLFSVPTFAATYYVDRNHSAASDDNPGTESAPFLTIRTAARVVSTGDTVVVKAGTYPERVSVGRSGAAGSKIVFRAEPARSVNMRGFTLNGNYLHVQGFVIENTSDSGILITGNYNSAADNAVRDVPAVGIRVQSDNSYPNWPHHAHIFDNYIEHCEYGIVVAGFDTVVERNEVFRVTNEGIEGDADYARFFGSRITYRYNYFHGTTWQDMSGLDRVQDTSDDAHVDVWQSFINNKPRGTIFSDITLDGNIFRNCGQGAFWKALDSGARFKNVRYTNNVVLPPRSGERTTRAPVNIYETDGLVIENNTFIGTIGVVNAKESCTNDSIANNIFYRCEWAYSPSHSSTSTHGNNIIFKTGIPRDLDPRNDVRGVDPGLIDPFRIPSNWIEAFAPDAGWRVANTRYAHLGAQIPPFANSLVLRVRDDTKLYVDVNSQNNKLYVLNNDFGYQLKIKSFDDSQVVGTMILDPAGDLRYTPPQDFLGKENFTYTVEDYSGDTATASAQIRVVDLPLTSWVNWLLVLIFIGAAWRLPRYVR